jgi:crossover junction endodeoxyribonuclease RuvC
VTPAQRATVFLGVDPGTTTTGYGIIKAVDNMVSWVDSGVIRPRANAGLPEKIEYIYDSLCEKIATCKPQCVCIEQAFYGKNARTALVLGCARAAAMLAAQKSGARIVEFSPLEIKKAVVGNGNAAKEQVTYMINTLLHPKKKHRQYDAYDALAAALCAFYHRRSASIVGQ